MVLVYLDIFNFPGTRFHLHFYGRWVFSSDERIKNKLIFLEDLRVLSFFDIKKAPVFGSGPKKAATDRLFRAPLTVSSLSVSGGAVFQSKKKATRRWPPMLNVSNRAPAPSVP